MLLIIIKIYITWWVRGQESHTLPLLPQVKKNSTLVKASFPVKLKIGSNGYLLLDLSLPMLHKRTNVLSLQRLANFSILRRIPECFLLLFP